MTQKRQADSKIWAQSTNCCPMRTHTECTIAAVKSALKNDGMTDNSDPFASFSGDFSFFGDENRGGARETPRGAIIVMDLLVMVTLEELYIIAIINIISTVIAIDADALSMT